MVKYAPKDFEIYVAHSDGTFDVGDKAVNTSLGKFFDSAVTAGTAVTDFIKLVDTVSISIEPAEDETTTKKYLGSTSTGAQNTDTSVTENPDVDITLSADPAIVEQLGAFILAEQTDSHTDYTNYARFSLGSKNQEVVLLLVRVYKQVGSTYYYKNYLFTDPKFKKVDSLDITGDDDVATVEYSLTGEKSYTDKDFYSGTTKEVVTNLDN